MRKELFRVRDIVLKRMGFFLRSKGIPTPWFEIYEDLQRLQDRNHDITTNPAQEMQHKFNKIPTHPNIEILKKLNELADKLYSLREKVKTDESIERLEPYLLQLKQALHSNSTVPSEFLAQIEPSLQTFNQNAEKINNKRKRENSDEKSEPKKKKQKLEHKGKEAKNQDEDLSASDSDSPEIEGFLRIKRLTPKAGEFLHKTFKARSSADHKSSPDLDTAEWFVKFEKERIVRHHEVIAQEIARLINPSYPETGYSRDTDGDIIGVKSKELKGCAILANLIDTDDSAIGGMGLAGSKSKKEKLKKTKEVQQDILSGKISGLGEMIITSFFVNETDLRLENIALLNNKLIKFDGDHCFSRLREPEDEYYVNEVSEQDLLGDNLSLYNPWNWLELRLGGKTKLEILEEGDPFNEPAVLTLRDENGVKLTEKPFFRLEVNSTILKFLIMPAELFKNLIYHYCKDTQYAATLHKELTGRIQSIRKVAFKNKSFQEFLKNDTATQKVITEHLKNLEQFKLSGTESLWNSIPHLENEIRAEFNKLIGTPTAIVVAPTNHGFGAGAGSGSSSFHQVTRSLQLTPQAGGSYQITQKSTTTHRTSTYGPSVGISTFFQQTAEEKKSNASSLAAAAATLTPEEQREILPNDAFGSGIGQLPSLGFGLGSGFGFDSEIGELTSGTSSGSGSGFDLDPSSEVGHLLGMSRR